MSGFKISDELEDIRKHCTDQIEGSEVIACLPAIVRVSITRTKYKQITAVLQFPENYPSDPLITELKSKALPDKLLEGLTKACDQEAKKYLGRPQILRILKFLRQFIDEKPLCICSHEINQIKCRLSEDDECKIVQKTSSVHLKLVQRRYYISIKFTVPDYYPDEQLTVEEKDSNFPPVFRRWFVAQSTEIARQCIQPPLKKKPKDPVFKPKPSMLPIFNFLFEEVKKYPSENCLVCRERCFPDNPDDVVTKETDGKHVERVYCSHAFHNDCLIKYMKTPPFQGGKKCPGCGKRIFHEKWKLSPRLAEERWAHHEAKRRELDEVVDFMQ